MKNKGFTLIEILSVITLITVIGLVSVYSVTNQLRNQEEKTYENYKEIILNATELYVEQNRELYPNLVEVNDTVNITVNDLIESEYLKEDLKNPKTNEKVDKLLQIKVTVGEDLILVYEILE